MTFPKLSASDDTLPPGRIIRWIVIAGVLLFSVGLYFRFGLQTPPVGTPPAAADTTTTP